MPKGNHLGSLQMMIAMRSQLSRLHRPTPIRNSRL